MTQIEQIITDNNYLNVNYLHQDITKQIIKAFYNVYNTLGYGFLEKVYQNALLIELSKIGFNCHSEFPIDVYYEGSNVGKYFADIIVEEKVIIEIKAKEAICEEHEYQLINYLKATDIEVGLLMNFGKNPELKRKIFTNDRKLLNTDDADSTD